MFASCFRFQFCSLCIFLRFLFYFKLSLLKIHDTSLDSSFYFFNFSTLDITQNKVTKFNISFSAATCHNTFHPMIVTKTAQVTDLKKKKKRWNFIKTAQKKIKIASCLPYKKKSYFAWCIPILAVAPFFANPAK